MKTIGYIPLFALRRSVKIPAYPFLYVDDSDLRMIERVFIRHVDKEMKAE